MNANSIISKPATDARLLLLSPLDNVYVLRGLIKAGEDIIIDGCQVTLKSSIGLGHKLAKTDLCEGIKIIKYGAPIGSLTRDAKIGEHIHVTNLRSDYTPTYSLEDELNANATEPEVGA